MFNPALQDLLKPQWLRTLTELKTTGGMAVSDLSKRFDSSYMTVKQHCEELNKRGYLKRTRVPRTEIGRPEIFYSLSEKALAMFPALPPHFTFEIFEQIQTTFGETAPDKLLFQYFQGLESQWKVQLEKDNSTLQKAQRFAKIRWEDGAFLRCTQDPETDQIQLREFHNPFHELFEKFPRAIAMELRAMEAALGVKISREGHVDGSGQATHVDFVFQETQAPE